MIEVAQTSLQTCRRSGSPTPALNHGVSENTGSRLRPRAWGTGRFLPSQRTRSKTACGGWSALRSFGTEPWCDTLLLCRAKSGDRASPTPGRRPHATSSVPLSARRDAAQACTTATAIPVRASCTATFSLSTDAAPSVGRRVYMLSLSLRPPFA